MYTKLGKVLALLLAFFMGVGLTAYWYSRAETTSKRIPAETSFIFGHHARIMSVGGLYEDLSIYEASDGTTVTVIEGNFLKAVPPERELANLLGANQVEVIERKPITDEKSGQQLGERIVGRASVLGSEPHAFIFKTHGSWNRRIEGRSLNHLLEIEKTLK